MEISLQTTDAPASMDLRQYDANTDWTCVERGLRSCDSKIRLKMLQIVLNVLETKFLGIITPSHLIEMTLALSKEKEWESQHSGLCIMKCILTKTKLGEDTEHQFMGVLTSMANTSERKIIEILPDCYYELNRKFSDNRFFLMVKDPLIEIIYDGLGRPRQDLGISDVTSSGKDFPEFGKGGGSIIEPEARLIEYRLQMMRRLIESGGKKLHGDIDSKVLKLFEKASLSENRFLREIGYGGLIEVMHVGNLDLIDAWKDTIVVILDRGLMDHWSEVRLAASMATFLFLTMEGKRYFQESFLKILLPKMALNRHHAADRIRSYCLEAWQVILGPIGGKDFLNRHVDDTIDYYIGQLDADNGGVREAACHALSEVVINLHEHHIGRRIKDVILGLMNAIRDDNWSVREGACLAIGECISRFGMDLRELYENDLFDLLLAHLSDNAGSVRGASASAIAKGVLVYREMGIRKVLEVIEELLTMVRQQAFDPRYMNKAIDTKFCPSEKKIFDNDPEVHSGQITFSCCSFAPRLKRIVGCVDHGFLRNPEPWEFSDGSMHLLREISVTHPRNAFIYLPRVLEMATLPAFPHYQCLLETIWKQMSLIYVTLTAKPHSEDPSLSDIQQALIELLPSAVKAAHKGLTCQNRLAMNAAGYFIDTIVNIYGLELIRERTESSFWLDIQQSPYVETTK